MLLAVRAYLSEPWVNGTAVVCITVYSDLFIHHSNMYISYKEGNRIHQIGCHGYGHVMYEEEIATAG